MGYRSDVVIMITKGNKDISTIKRELNEDEKILPLLKWAEVFQVGADGIRMGFSWIKWYEIQRITNYLTENAQAQNLSYSFVRVGEEDGDIEQINEGTPKYLAYVSTTISTDVLDMEEK